MESRSLLSAVGFAVQSSMQSNDVQAVADIDGDGDLDFISEKEWRENTADGLGETSRFDFSPTSTYQIKPIDLDRDGDIDLLSSNWVNEQSLHKVWWFENQAEKFAAPQLLTTATDRIIRDFSAADMNDDGHLDLLIAECDSRRCLIDWRMNDGALNFDQPHAVGTTRFVRSLQTVDTNLDGKPDVVVGSDWFENQGSGEAFVQRSIDLPSEAHELLPFSGVIDDDQALDFLSIKDSREIYWLELNPETGLTEIQAQLGQSQGTEIIEAEHVSIADVDRDGRLDVFVQQKHPVGDSNRLMRYYTLPDGSFASTEVVSHAPLTSDTPEMVDVDHDGYLDLLYAKSSLRFNPNENRFDSPLPLTVADADYVVAATDMDGDGDIDLVSIDETFDCMYAAGKCSRSIRWRENQGDGTGLNSAPKVIFDQEFVTGFKSVKSLHIMDVDGDGDLDVAYQLGQGACDSSTTVWLENLDGQGAFSNTEQMLQFTGRILQVRDYNGDGSDELLVRISGNLAVYSSLTDATPLAVIPDGDNVGLPTPFDWDGDGDLDLVAIRSVNEGTEYVWFEQSLDAFGFLPHRHIVTVDERSNVDHCESWPRQLLVADMDGDGDSDIVTESGRLFENQAAQSNPEEQFVFVQRLLAPDKDGVSAARVVDIDHDGDQDILGRAESNGVTMSMLLTNDGQNRFGASPTPSWQILADVDGDADIDIIKNGAVWLENRPVGDVNDDGVFDSSDLVLAMQAGEYEDGIDLNSQFDAGDWNGDLDFNSQDLVLAFQSGHYLP